MLLYLYSHPTGCAGARRGSHGQCVSAPRGLVHTATQCNTLQHTATHCDTLQHTATHCDTLQHTATHCDALQHTATHCHTLRRTATHCNTPQHTKTHRNTLQHTATHCKRIVKHSSSNVSTTAVLVFLCIVNVAVRWLSRMLPMLWRRSVKHCSTPQHNVTHCNTLQHSIVATSYTVIQRCTDFWEYYLGCRAGPTSTAASSFPRGSSRKYTFSEVSSLPDLPWTMNIELTSDFLRMFTRCARAWIRRGSPSARCSRGLMGCVPGSNAATSSMHMNRSWRMHDSLCVAVYCSLLQCVAVCCSV